MAKKKVRVVVFTTDVPVELAVKFDKIADANNRSRRRHLLDLIKREIEDFDQA